MYTFTATRTEGIEYSPMPFAQDRGHGRWASGPVVMVLRTGSGWVRDEEGTIVRVSAPSVTSWGPGDWVEYGSDASVTFKADLYWAVPPSARQPADAMAEVLSIDG
jgi:hypothetical protein